MNHKHYKLSIAIYIVNYFVDKIIFSKYVKNIIAIYRCLIGNF